MELTPCGTFEWIRIVRRMPVTILAPTDKFIGLLLASYADPDGTRIRTGTELLILVSGKSESVVKRSRRLLRSEGFIECTAERYKNGCNGGSDEYRLTRPADILDRYALLDPDIERGSWVTPVKRRKLSTAAT